LQVSDASLVILGSSNIIRAMEGLSNKQEKQQ